MTNAIEFTHPDKMGHARALIDLFVVANSFEEASNAFLAQITKMLDDHSKMFLDDADRKALRQYAIEQKMIDD